MNRRDLLKVVVAAPWVITTAGVLMPARSLSRPRLGVDRAAPGADRSIYVRFSGIGADGFLIREFSTDAMRTWREDRGPVGLALWGEQFTVHYPAGRR